MSRKLPLQSRRSLLAGTLAAPFAVLRGQDAITIPGKRPLLVHNDYPEDLETPLNALETFITPNDAFFVRQHLPRPTVDPAAWRLEIDGLVDRKTSFSLSDLKKLPQHRLPATLECAGNGRRNFRPSMPGLQWGNGAMGNAEWRGPRLSDIFSQAKVQKSASYLNVDGADAGPATTPDFIRSIPMRKAMHPDTILALEMNGEPLPALHGAPARLVVPGWDGASWVKWVVRLSAADATHPGFYMATAYRYPRFPAGPGIAAKPEDMEIIEGLAVKSFFTSPVAAARLTARGSIALKGIAWGGENRIVKVEVSTDGGARWSRADLGRDDYQFAWRHFSYPWTPSRPGQHILCCRATDSAGRIQPIEPVWNQSGYLWNGIERVSVVVEA